MRVAGAANSEDCVDTDTITPFIGATACIAFDGAVLIGKQRSGGQVGVVVPF